MKVLSHVRPRAVVLFQGCWTFCPRQSNWVLLKLCKWEAQWNQPIFYFLQNRVRAFVFCFHLNLCFFAFIASEDRIENEKMILSVPDCCWSYRHIYHNHWCLSCLLADLDNHGEGGFGCGARIAMSCAQKIFFALRANDKSQNRICVSDLAGNWARWKASWRRAKPTHFSIKRLPNLVIWPR